MHIMRIAESELIINDDGSVFHIHLRPEELADNVILVGDPGRVEMVAGYLEDREFMHASREFVSVTGMYRGKRVTVLSTGIGTDNIDIVMNELDALANIDFQTREPKPDKRSLNILRIGTSGAIQPDIPIGSFVFSHISIGCDGLLNWYAGRDGIVVPDIEEAFKAHVGWDRHLPDPYFVHAGEDMCRRFEDCTVKGMTTWWRSSRASGSGTGVSPTSRWKGRPLPGLPPISAIMPVLSAPSLPTGISRAATRTTSRM